MFKFSTLGLVHIDWNERSLIMIHIIQSAKPSGRHRSLLKVKYLERLILNRVVGKGALDMRDPTNLDVDLAQDVLSHRPAPGNLTIQGVVGDNSTDCS